ncbi:MAG TPA: hypothetical protein DEQ40_10645 [Oxalobacteraceae bacterium]|jgi:hypothetical protein|nr:hypothetical protein [Oxalobacteraceae bacterium]
MISRQKQFDLDEALPGMTLSDDILDAHGGVLLPRGTTMTEATLLSLRRRGIDKLLVVNEALSAADLAAEQERLLQRLDRLFRKCRNQEASELLLQSVTQYRLGESV